MKIIVTGASGLVGHATVQVALKRGHDVVAFYHNRKPDVPPSVRLQQMDLTTIEGIVPILLHEFPDAIINAAAVSNPAAVDAQPDLAEKLNVALPRRLAQVAHHLSGRLIHISTDMVFDGSQQQPYSSTDTPHPLNLYGQMKLLAEREVLQHGGKSATVLRIAIVTGNSPSTTRSLHEKLLACLANGEKPTLYTNEIRQPNSADNVAAVLVELCERSHLSGIFHWAGAEPISRYAMGLRILKRFSLPEDWITPAEDDNPKRPHHLTFNLEPLLSKLKTRPTFFADQLEDARIPPVCQTWYANMLNLSEATMPPPRLIKGRDF